MGDYPNNYKVRNSDSDTTAFEASLAKADQMLGLMSSTFDELTSVMQEIPAFMQSVSDERSSRARIGEAQGRMREALEGIQKALAEIKQQKRDAEQNDMITVYGLPPWISPWQM